MHQLLWLETLLKLAGGALLLVAPLTTLRVFGLPRVANGFWPRLLGAVLIGLAGATFIEGAWEGSRGLGLAGLMINLSVAAVLAALALFGAGAETRRGAIALWSLVVALVVLVLFEIAHA